MSTIDDYFFLSLQAALLPLPQRDQVMAAQRWRVPYVWPQQQVAATLCGGVDQRLQSVETERAMEQALSDMGYTLVRLSPRRVRSGEAVADLQRVLGEVATLH